MSRPSALVLTALFIVLVPGTVAVYIPWALSAWRFQSAFLGLEAGRWLGAVLVALGAIVVLDAWARFAWQGLGTPAPIAPPQRLVVSGFYRFVRNPMYVGVVALVVGQGLIFASAAVLAYAAVLAAGFHLFVLFYEEPTLRRKFPADYPAFTAAVPRWIPRLRPWRGGG